MTLSKDTNVLALIEAEPYLVDALISINPGFEKLRNPLFRNTMARMASLETAAGFMGQPVDGLVAGLRQAILADIIRELHGGVALDSAKARFTELVHDVSATEIGAMEQALIAGGMPAEEIKQLCHVHVQVFQESLDQKPLPEIGEDHPLAIFAAENKAIFELCQRMDELVEQMLAPDCPSVQGQAIGSSPDCGSCGVAPEDEGYLVDRERFRYLAKDLARLADWFGKVDHHYQRKENQLFPVLEAKGVTGPTQVMWGVDDEIRSGLKKLRQSIGAERAEDFAALVGPSLKALRDMIYKEERILFPLCLEKFDAADWERVRSGEAGLGYGLAPARQAPAPDAQPALVAEGSIAAVGTMAAAPLPDGRLQLATGTLSLAEARAIFRLLPVDISFVNAQDEVVFYSDNPERIFPRTPSVIGRKVQFCHPPKSMHLVQRILDDFRSGLRSHSEFWINLGGRFIHIQYFAVRGDDGAYLGCLEASQDLTRLRSLEGEKRLLD